MSNDTSLTKLSSTDVQDLQDNLIDISDPSEESPYMCPICLTWLKDPMLTSCGHRFCKSCIESWLERESACCPVDNTSLSHDKDLFPDNFTRRELSQRKVKCPYSNFGCTKVLSVSEKESHMAECSFSKVESQIKGCTFKIFGCDFSGNAEEINQHNVECMTQHLTLISEAYTNLNALVRRNSDTSSKMEESKLWDAPSKDNTDSSVDKNQELIRAMYERIIVLEQRTNEQDITIRNLRKEINELKIRNENIVEDTLLQYCGGVFIWTITDFKNKLETMKKDANKMYYSKGFYTSPNGYRFCGRLNLSPKNPEFIGLLVHVMQSNHDNALEWPFSGKISLTVVHPTNSYQNIKETMMTRPDLEAFQRSPTLMNPLGFGYTEFIEVEELLKKGFLQKNTLTVKIQIQAV